MQIICKDETLSDGSKAPILLLVDDDNKIEFCCISEKDRDDLADILYLAIDSYTLDTITDSERRYRQQTKLRSLLPTEGGSGGRNERIGK